MVRGLGDVYVMILVGHESRDGLGEYLRVLYTYEHRTNELE